MESSTHTRSSEAGARKPNSRLDTIANFRLPQRELAIGYLRYEAIRKMSRLELLELYTASTKGKRFDDLVDKAVIRNHTMTATLTFTIPDEQDTFENAVHANDVRSAIDELREDIRAKQKHGHSFESADKAIEYFHLRLCEI